MAKALTFKMAGSEYNAVPVKLERKKVYGWSAMVATDKNGAACSSAYLSPDDSLVIPAGGIKQALVDTNGCWVEKSQLVAYSEDGETRLPIVPSSFDTVITLEKAVTMEEFLDHEWDSVYQLNAPSLSTQIGDSIFTFPFCYKGGTNVTEAFVMNTPGGLFLFAGHKQEFPFVTLADETTIDDTEEMEEVLDEHDFSMF